MKQKIKITAAIIFILLVTIVAINAEIVRPRYVAINSFSCSLKILSGNAKCKAFVSVSNPSNSILLSITLKRSVDGFRWVTMQSWTATGSGILGTSIDATIKVASGYKYKLLAKATIKNNSGAIIETVSKSSGIVNH